MIDVLLDVVGWIVACVVNVLLGLGAIFIGLVAYVMWRETAE